MLRRILTAKISSIAGAAIVISGLGLVSRLMGLVRDQILLGKLGAGQILDSYYAAFRVPDFIFNLVVLGALSAGFIPIFTAMVKKEDQPLSPENDNAWYLANNFLNVFSLLLIIISAGLFIFARPLIDALVSGFSEAQKNQTVMMTRILFLSPILLGLSAVLGDILQVFKRFVIFSLAPILYNLGIIISVVFGYKFIGWLALPIGVIIGAGLHFLIQLVGCLRLGYRYRPIFKFRDKNLIEIFRLMMPRVFSLATAQVTLLFSTFFISFLAEGSNTIYNLANNLQSLPLGLIGIPLAMAAFPTLASSFANNRSEEFNQKLESTMRLLIFITVPVTVICLLLNVSLVTFLFNFGKFDFQSVTITANVFAVLIMSLLPQCFVPLLSRAFFARYNSSVPLYTSLICMVITVLFSWLLVEPFGLLGLALAFSIGSIINFVILLTVLQWQTNFFFWQKILKSFIKVCLASLACGALIIMVKFIVAIFWPYKTFISALIELSSGTILGLTAYVIVCFALKCPEMQAVWNGIKRRLIKFQNKKTTPEAII